MSPKSVRFSNLRPGKLPGDGGCGLNNATSYCKLIGAQILKPEDFNQLTNDKIPSPDEYHIYGIRL
jgi:hypothetical protein